MGDFYHMIDARDIWNAIKARFGGNAESKKMQKSLLKQKFKEFKISKEEGLDKGYDKMQKILTQMNTLKINPDLEDINMKFLRGLPSSWSGYSSSSPNLSNATFVSTAGSSQGNLSYQKSGNGGYGGYTTTLSASPDLDQMNKDFEEYDLKHQMAMLSIKQMGHFSRECRAQGAQTSNNYQKYKSKEAGKDGSDSKAMVVVDDADSEGEVVSADAIISAGLVAAAAVSPQSKTEFALMGLSTEELYAPSNIPDIDESQMVYGKTTTDSSEIKTNDDSISHSHDSVLFDFSDRSSKPSTNDFQTCGSSQECSRPNHSDHDSNDSISSVSAPANYDLHEQRLVKRNAEGKGKLVRRPTGKPVNLNRPKPVSACQPNPVFAGKATLACNSILLSISAGNGILGPRQLNIQSKSTYFHSFTHNNQQIIFPITHNSLYSLYMTSGLNGKTAVKPSAGWPWIKYGMSKTKGSKINGGSKPKRWSYAKGPLGRPKSEMTWVPKEN
uniref:Uncharacterized protein n=1 Tax=Tanacetum cinerariifolium TaxID=118510 RepID=A0A6L2L9D3_TANCI|nr:hypothetical protein [Tanacetum cinerariifolium]